MVKARSRDQMAFDFGMERFVHRPAALAGSGARTSVMVGELLNSDHRARQVIAAEMSVLMDEDISKAMLDAWSAPAKPDHAINYARMKGLIVVTGRSDLLDRDLREIGLAVVSDEGMKKVHLGHLHSEIAKAEEQVREMKRLARAVERGRP